MEDTSLDYQQWQAEVPAALKQDALWKMGVYRAALFAADRAWQDVTTLARDRRTVSVADQLNRALGSISANIAEGYSRGTGKDRARFYEYALGSTREARDWYFKARHILGNEVTEERLTLLTQIIRMLLTILPQERGSSIAEERAVYTTSATIWEEMFLDVPDLGPI